MKDYKKMLGELGFDYEGSFAGGEVYINQAKVIKISILPKNGEILDIEYVTVGDRYFDSINLWSILDTIAVVEDKLLKWGFIFAKFYTFVLPNERKQKREMSDRNREEREI